VERLQHQHLEHQHGIIGRSAALRAIRARQHGFKIAAEQFEIHQKNPGCPAIADPPQPRPYKTGDSPQNASGF
jgi:hypothetical protein